MNTDPNTLLREIRHENQLRSAYIAGISKGFEITEGYEKLDRDQFGDIVERGFREWIEDQ